MQHRIVHATLLIFTVALAVGGTPQRAFGDDADDNTPATPSMDPSLQWQLADAAWGRREYDDAASLMISYATANPNGDNAVEALWRAYNVYRSYRPNADRKKIVYEKGVDLASKWAAAFADSDKGRAAKAMWYVANFRDGEGDRVLAIAELTDLVKRFPGTSSATNAYWTMAEWMREAHQCAGAIDNYKAFQTAAGLCENWNVAAFRIGNCYEELQDKEKAIESYSSVLDQPKNNWGWWQLGSGAVDAARRVRALGDEATCRRLATQVTLSCPTDGGWADIQRQAMQIVGENPAKKIQLVVGRTVTYEVSPPFSSIGADASVPVRYDTYIQVRPRYLTLADSLSAVLTLTSVLNPESVPTTFKKLDDPAGAQFAATIESPDKNGKVAGDSDFTFDSVTGHAPSPDGLSVSRLWAQKGADWGEETIRIQSNQRWNLWIKLPNNKTNSSNMTNQPDDVSSDGMTFHWNDRTDLSHGITIKFPIELGANDEQYYPQVRLEREWHLESDREGTSTAVTDKLSEYGFALTSGKPFAYQLTYPVKSVVILDEKSTN